MYLGIDIGGSKTLLALFSDKGKLRKKLKFKTDQNPEQFSQDLKRNLSRFFPKNSFFNYSLDAVVVAIAATVDSTYHTDPSIFAAYYNKYLFDSGVSPKTTPKFNLTRPTTFGKPKEYGNLPWKGFNFVSTIEDCITFLFRNNRVKLSPSAPKLTISDTVKYSRVFPRICPIYIQNDANLAAFFEAKRRTGKSIYLTYSTGIGAGIMENGKLTPESDSFEPGHRKYTWQGKRLEYEDIAGAKAIEIYYEDKQKRLYPNKKPKKVIATSLRGKEVYQDMALRISIGLVDIIKEQNPDHIIIGGALGLQLKNFRRYLLPILAISLNCDKESLPDITAAKFPLESVVHGCYLYGKANSR